MPKTKSESNIHSNILFVLDHRPDNLMGKHTKSINILLYGFSARMGSPVKIGSDWPSLLMADTSNWYKCPGLRPEAVALGVVVVQAVTHSPLSMSMYLK